PILVLIIRPDKTLTTQELTEKYATENSNFINWKGAKIHYKDEGTGTPLMMVHGFAGSFTNWTPLSEFFKDDYRIVTIDLPGFGLSEFPDLESEPTYTDLYSDYVRFIIDTLHLDSVTIIGNSLGGYVSCEVALRHPEKIEKLVLINSAGYDLDKIGKIFIRLSRTPIFGWIFSKGIPYILSKRAVENSVSVEVKEENVKIFHELLNRKETINTVSRLGGSGQLADTSRFSRIEQPTLIIWGEEDKVIPVKHADLFHAAIKKSRVVIYSDLGHVPMMEDPPRVAQDLKGFFAE
ncbi:MAG: alpha/beta fold hydrolase, partial [Flavobacteriales bacterium]